jgi:hypothetical protein
MNLADDSKTSILKDNGSTPNGKVHPQPDAKHSNSQTLGGGHGGNLPTGNKVHTTSDY